MYSWDGPAVHSLSDTTRALGGELLSLGTFAQPFEAEALCSTASDIAHFQRALVAGDLIGAHALERMQRSTRLDDGAEVSYGYGIHRRALDGRMGITYGGGLAGAHVSVTHYPEVDLTVVLFAHGEDARFEPLERHLSRLLMDGPEPELLDLPLEDDEAERYVGTFVVGCIHLSVEHHDGHLVLLPHMGARRSLLRQAEHVFAAADEPGVTVTFLLEDDRVAALVLDEHGARIEAQRQ